MNKQRVRQLCTITAHITRAAINISTPSKLSENSDSSNPVFLFYNNILRVTVHSPMIWKPVEPILTFLFLLEWLAVHNKQKIHFFALRWTLLSVKHRIRKVVTILIFFSWKYNSNYLLFQIARDTWEGKKKEMHKHNGVKLVYKEELSSRVNHVIPSNL